MIEAGFAHAPTLALLHRAAFPHDPWDTASFISLLAQPGMVALIDERGGFLLLRVVLDEAEIITLGAVTPRQGIGRALLQAAIAQAKAKNIAKIHLEVAVQNAPARALYQSLNFTETGRRKAYYPDGSDALALVLELP